MKRATIAIAFFLAITMILPCFTACNLGGKNNVTTAPVTGATPSSDPAATTAEPVETTDTDLTTSVDITTADVTTSPEATTVQDITTVSDLTTVPESTTTPDVTTVPEATTAPEVTTAPVETTPEIPVVTEPAHTHAFSAVWKTDASNHWKECSCGEKSESAGHTYGDWIVTKEATETTTGERYHICTVCGYKETNIIPTLNHMHYFGTAWESDGTNHWHVCACGERETVGVHTFGNWEVTKEATCTLEGEQRHICIVCGYETIEKIEKSAHTPVVDGAVAPTCTTAGKTEGSHCSVCGQIIEPQEVVPVASHSFGNWAVIKTPTCSDEGSKKHVCSVCGFEEIESVEKVAHTTLTDPAIAATCEEEGKTAGSHCSVCSVVLVAQQIIPALGHNYAESEVYPSSSEKGYILHHCTRCGKEYKDNFVSESSGLAYSNNGNGTCTITGLGTCTDSNIYIPTVIDGLIVSSIGNSAFQQTAIKKVYIPESVTEIGDAAFFGCIYMNKAIMSDNVEIIGNEAFAECKSLNSIIIPSKVTELRNTFIGCVRLDNITIPGNVQSLHQAFNGCTSLKNIILSNGIVTLGYASFCNCTSLNTIVIPESVTEIGEECFSWSGLIHLDLPKQIVKIGGGAFKGTSITSINLPNDTTVFLDWFYACESLVSFIIPEGTVEIGREAFAHCSSLKIVYMPKSIKLINDNAFIYCADDFCIQYAGTMEEWSLIFTGTQWYDHILENNDNRTLIIHCSDGDILNPDPHAA